MDDMFFSAMTNNQLTRLSEDEVAFLLDFRMATEKQKEEIIKVIKEFAVLDESSPSRYE